MKLAGALHIGVGLVLVAGGCQFVPFVQQDDDYARRVADSRLRRIDEAGLERFRKAQVAAALPKDPTAEAEAQAAASRARFAGLKSVDLTLEECRADTLKNNLDLKVAVVDPTIAAEATTQEEAKFNSIFTLNAGYQDLDTPTASQLVSGQSKNFQLTPGVRIPTRTGGDVTVQLPFTRNENNNQFSTLNPSYTSDLQFSISQPLLRGAGRRAATAALRIAGYNEQASASRTKLEVIRQLAAVDRSYWRLYQAKRELEVRQQQYELAVEQLGRAERRNKAGAVAEIEVIRAQAGVSDSLQAIISTQNTVLLQQRELKRIVNQPGLEVDTSVMIAAATQPDPVEYQFDGPQLMTEALRNRMELLELELQLAADAARIGLARNQALPLFSLDYTYRINGLGGTFNSTFHNLQRNHFEDWTVGLSAEIPLDNEEAESRVRSAILTRLQRLASKQARELSIRQEVLNAIDTLTADWQRILAARQAVILNTRALQAEQRQFDVGNSTSTFVLDA
ncbi:MAG: TolC family protein, partial [Phycisphaerales bacterium]